jgi:hypothetical protein
MCMNTPQSMPDVKPTKMEAKSGEPLTSRDPIFKVNKPATRRRNLTINRHS